MKVSSVPITPVSFGLELKWECQKRNNNNINSNNSNPLSTRRTDGGKKFLGKLWLIRHMIKANTSKEDLCKIYVCYLRPVIEYVQVVYHTLLSDDASQVIEDLQKQALKLIFGKKQSFEVRISNYFEVEKSGRFWKIRRANI